MHVAVGGEGLAAHVAFVGSLSAVDQHVSVQRRGRAQALPADAAGVVGGAGVGVVLRGTNRRGDRCTYWPMVTGVGCVRASRPRADGSNRRCYLSDVHGELVLCLTVLVAQRTGES